MEYRQMKDINNVHCFFEQSGTFKNEFKKIGFPLLIMTYKTIMDKQIL